MAAVTMIGSGLAALAQDDIKRVLAYSTIGQLGYMPGALAVGDRDAAVFHLLSHGAFKALLFLAAGVIIHAAGTNSLAAMSRMGGLAKRIPDAYWTMTVAPARARRHPALRGFFSKESVLVAAEHAAFGEPRRRARRRRLDGAGRRPGRRPAHRRVRHPAVAARLPRERPRGRRPRQAARRHDRRAVGAGHPHHRLRPDHRRARRLVRRPQPHPDPHHLRPRHRRRPGRRTRHLRRLAAQPRAPPSPRPMGAVAAHPDGEPALIEAEAIATHTRRTATSRRPPTRATPAGCCSARCTATPPSASTSTPSTRAVRTPRAGRRPAGPLPGPRGRRDLRARRGHRARWLGAAVRRAQTGNVQTYLSALLAGSVVLAIAAVLVNVNAGA